MDSITASEKNEKLDEQKIELSRNDLLKLLSCLEGKLEASEIAIAALKVDRLKRLFYPATIKRSTSNKSKFKRNSLNYATIIPTSKCSKNDKESSDQLVETFLDSNLDTNLKNDSNKLETNLDDFNRELEDDEHDIKNDDSLFPNDKYNQYRKGLDTNPYLALASDMKYAYDNEANESLIVKVYNSRVLRIKQLVRQQQEARKFLEEQLDELSSRYKNVVDELEIEKDKNIKFHRDEIVKKLEKTEQEKKDLEEEFNSLKKEFETEKEREKIMIVYLLSERKQLIIRLIEESEKNTELVNLLSSEKNRSTEMEEGLEEESKRSLQMEIELECLANKYETEIKSRSATITCQRQLEERLKGFEKRNEELESECDELKQKLNEILNSNSNNNNLITINKNLPDIGEGVRSTIVTFNNAIANLTANSTVVSSTNIQNKTQIPNVVQSIQTKPSLAAKPSIDSLNNSNNANNSTTNGNKATVTILNNQPVRSNSIQLKNSLITNKNVNNSLSNNVSTSTTSTSVTSVASVIQKFHEFSNTISNNQSQPTHPPIVKKLSSSGLVANIANTIVSQTTGNNRKPPPPVPQKPQINPQIIKERTAKIFEQQQTSNSQQFTN